MSSAAFIVTCWIGLGMIGAGFSNAYYQRNWPALCQGRQDLGQSVMAGVIWGPFDLALGFLYTGFGEYGWSLSAHANPKCARPTP